MHRPRLLAAALLTAATFAGGHALAANVCRTDRLTCPTTMPVDGYCECTGRGTTEGGTVMATQPHPRHTAHPGGCGADKQAPGCR